MNLGEKEAVPDNGLAQGFLPVGYDVGRVEQLVFGQPGDGAASVISCQYGLPERGLVESLLHQMKPVPAFGIGMWRRDNVLPWSFEYLPGFQGGRIPARDKGGDNGFLTSRRDAQKIDDRYPLLEGYPKPTVVSGVRSCPIKA